jgi:hypothetical protein
MELPVLCDEIFEEALPILHLLIEPVVLLLNSRLLLIGTVVLECFLQLVELTFLELIVLLVLLVFQYALCLCYKFLKLRKPNLLLDLRPFNHLVPVLQLMLQLLFLLEHTRFEGVQVLFEEFILDSF